LQQEVKDEAMQVQESSVVSPVTADQYKRTLAHWATGVTVLSTVAGDASGDNRVDVGITASSFTSLSLDPPQVLVSVTKRLYTHDALINSGIFAVSFLHEDQVEWGKRFAGMMPEIEDRFAGIAVTRAATGCAILSDALAWVDCRVTRVYDGNDHSILVGEVLVAGAQDIGAPLIYYHRNWRGLGPQQVG
jgi:flavin reductase (DIM6/NTAB) family NADH-FMN oxidoreductase RutF